LDTWEKIKIDDDEISILEKAKYQNITHNGQQEQGFTPEEVIRESSKSKPNQIVPQGRKDHQDNVYRFAPRIEDQRGY